MEQDVFAFDDYRSFLHACLKGTGADRGLVAKCAASMQIHSSLLSRVLAGERDLSAEQIALAAEFLRLDSLATRYLVALLSRERAGTDKLRELYSAELQRLRAEKHKYFNLIRDQSSVSEEDLAVYLASPDMQLVLSSAALKDCDREEKICQRLGMSRERVDRALDFLLARGWMVREAGGRLRKTPLKMVFRQNPLLGKLFTRHWRLHVLNRQAEVHPEQECSLTTLVCLKREDAEKVVKELKAVAAAAYERNVLSDADDVYTFTLDFLKC